MHMANELLSPSVAVTTFAVASISIGVICRKAKQVVTTDKLALMGIMGAFVFAGQMINIPLLAGTSGHLTGAVLLAVLLGPWAGAIAMSSVVIVQCLIFFDGGILALGCNLINMAIVPSFVGYWIYKLIVHEQSLSPYSTKSILAVTAACMISVLLSSLLVPIEAGLSGVLSVPFATFAVTMLSVHALIGIMESIITIMVLAYLRQVCPDVFQVSIGTIVPARRKRLYAAAVIATVIIGAGLSLLASSLPDGLEWSYAERPDQPEFTGMVENTNPSIEKADALQEKYSVLPDYSVKTTSDAEASQGWTSFSGVIGSMIVMAVILLTGYFVRKKDPANAPHTN